MRTIRSLSFGIVVGALITAGTFVASEAHADVTQRDVAKYAVQICGALDESNSLATVFTIVLALGDQGYSGYDSGRLVAMAVSSRCPEYEPTLYRFVETFAEESQGIA